MSEDRKVRVGCGVILFNKKGQFLMLKRRRTSHCEGTYCLPGGWLEFGESFEDNAKREALEEVGVAIENIKVLGLTNNIFEKERMHTVSVMMAATVKDGEEPVNMETEKCEKIVWVDDWGSLPKPWFIAYHDWISQDMINTYKKETGL